MNMERLPNGLIRITFDWDDRYGECYDCGIPAAYENSIGQRLCSVDAAMAASTGDNITYLFHED